MGDNSLVPDDFVHTSVIDEIYPGEVPHRLLTFDSREGTARGGLVI